MKFCEHTQNLITGENVRWSVHLENKFILGYKYIKLDII